MGYMGLTHWSESDNAADFHYSVSEAKSLKGVITGFTKELKNEANCYNTCGAINIALVVEDGFLDKYSNTHKKKFKDVIHKTVAKLDSMIREDENDTNENVKWHVTNFRRLSNSLTNWLKDNK